MPSAAPAVLCVYRYDPMDRLAACSVTGRESVHCFYQKNLLSTHIQGHVQHTLLRTDEYLLAQQAWENNQTVSMLLMTDQQQSVVATPGLALSYTAYGYRQPLVDSMNLPGFTGQRVDPVTGHYLLGNGYRAFNPVLMRFNSPDRLSPFGEGGVNAYAYCGGDPVNWVDLTGSTPVLFKGMLRALKIIKPSRRLSTGSVTDSSVGVRPVEVANASDGVRVPVSHPVNSSLSGGSSRGATVRSSRPTDPPSSIPPPSPPPTPKGYFKVSDTRFSLAEAKTHLSGLRGLVRSASSREVTVLDTVSRNIGYFEGMVNYARRRNNVLVKPVGIAYQIRQIRRSSSGSSDFSD